MAQYKYTLGAAGERTAVKELNRTVEYTYDALYRLTSEKIAAADGTVTAYTYAYDNVSNRILKTENGAETVYTYNALNQLTAENDIIYAYDAAGNLISATSTTKSTLYVYNAENKLIRATVQEGDEVSVEEYEYDYAGNRTVKKSEGEYTYYLNDISGSLTQVLAEIDADDNEKCWYTRGIELISQERSGVVSYYLTDGHGSVRQLADSTGTVTDTYVYDAWGNLISSTGETENSYLYCGEQLDSTTGLYYLRARYMNPATGTFISMDTYQGTIFDPTSLHKYLYANANPVMNVDPSGNMAQVAMMKAEASYNNYVLAIYTALMAKLVYDVTIYATKNTVNEFLLDAIECISLISVISISKLAAEVVLNNELQQVLIGQYEMAIVFMSLKAYVAQKVAELSQNQKTTRTNLHHIVAQGSRKSVPARAVLLSVGIPINSDLNLVRIKEYVHWFMHTDVYYGWVNSLMVSSYTFFSDDIEEKLLNVRITLAFIKGTITMIDRSII